MSEEPQTNASSSPLLANRGLLIGLIVLAVIALIMACVFGFMLYRQFTEDSSNSSDTGPPPFPTQEVLGNCNNVGQPIVKVIDSSQTISVTVDVPVTVRVANQDFAMQTQCVPSGWTWTPPEMGEGTAVWLYGSIINYIVALPDVGQNRASLEQLTPGDEIVLTTIINMTGF